MKVNIAVMAGGQSRRFNADKTLELFHGKPLIQHPADRLKDAADEIIVVAKDCSKYSFLGIRCICDSFKEQCPMVGILTALRYFKAPFFAIAADSPFPNPSHVRKLFSALEGYSAAIPLINGKKHPLYACYSTGIAELLEEALSAGEYSLMKTVELTKAVYLDDLSLFDSENEKKSFININTRDDFNFAKKYTGDFNG